MRPSPGIRLFGVAMIPPIAALFVASYLFANGKAAHDIRINVATCAVITFVIVVFAAYWRAPRTAFERWMRLGLLGSLGLADLSQLAAGVGAFGWRADGKTVRSPTLHAVHTGASAATGISFILIGILGLVAMIGLVILAVTHRRPLR